VTVGRCESIPPCGSLRRDIAESPSLSVQPVAHDDIHHLALELIGHFSAGQIKLSCEHALRAVFVRPYDPAEDAPQHLVIGDPPCRGGGATACQTVTPEYPPHKSDSDHVWSILKTPPRESPLQEREWLDRHDSRDEIWQHIGILLYPVRAARVLPIMSAACAASRPFSIKYLVKTPIRCSVDWK